MNQTHSVKPNKTFKNMPPYTNHALNPETHWMKTLDNRRQYKESGSPNSTLVTEIVSNWCIYLYWNFFTIPAFFHSPLFWALGGDSLLMELHRVIRFLRWYTLDGEIRSANRLSDYFQCRLKAYKKVSKIRSVSSIDRQLRRGHDIFIQWRTKTAKICITMLNTPINMFIS